MNKIKRPKFLRFTSAFWMLIFGFSILFSGCERPVAERETAKIPVSAVTAERGILRETLFYVGDIKAEDEAPVYPKVTGKIIEEVAREGVPVKKGGALLYIDRDEVGFQFEKAPVESPIDGIVGEIYVDKGANVSPQIPVALVVNMDRVKVRLDVTEKDLTRVKEGQPASVKVDAYPDEEFAGMVEMVSPVVDLSSRTAGAEILIPNGEHKLKPGMFARIEILTRKSEKTLIITRDAIIKENSSHYVFVVGDDNRVRRRKIEIGLRENNRFEVIAGLAEGEVVVTMGNTRLKEGDMVDIIE